MLALMARLELDLMHMQSQAKFSVKAASSRLTQLGFVSLSAAAHPLLCLLAYQLGSDLIVRLHMGNRHPSNIT